MGLKNDTLYKNLGVTLSGTTTVVLPSTGVFTLGTTSGKVRIKVYSFGGTSPTVSSVLYTATDGTNTVTFASFNPATAFAGSSTAWLDMFEAYLLDTAPSTTNGGTVGQLI